MLMVYNAANWYTQTKKFPHLKMLQAQGKISCTFPQKLVLCLLEKGDHSMMDL